MKIFFIFFEGICLSSVAIAACLIKAENGGPGCKLCDVSEYSLNFLKRNIDIMTDCKRKKSQINYTKDAFIRAAQHEGSNTSQESKGSIKNPYASFNETLRLESLEAAAYKEEFVNIYIIADIFYYEEENEGYNYFRGTNVSLKISPAFCENFPSLNNCVVAGSKPTIYFKSGRVNLFVSNSISIKSINLDWSDVWTNSSCKRMSIVCCKRLDINTINLFPECFDFKNQEKFYNSNEKTPEGIVNLEALIISDSNVRTPVLDLSDVNLINFFAVNMLSNTATIFIKQITQSMGIIHAKQLSIKNCFFSGGIISGEKDFKQSLFSDIKNLILQENLSFEAQPLINFEDIEISDYTRLGLNFSFDSLRLFDFQGFRGSLLIQNITFKNIDLGELLSTFIYFSDWQDKNLDYSFSNQKEIILNISRCLVQNSSASSFLEATPSQVNDLKIKIIVSMDIGKSLFSKVLILSHISEFRLETNYSGYVPKSCFLFFEYSVIFVYNSSFENIFLQNDLSAEIPAFFKSSSDYQASIIQQFNTNIENSIRLAQDEIYFSGLRVFNISAKINFMINIHSIFRLQIENCQFTILSLGVARFIYLSIEGQISITNSIFQEINCENHFILIEPGYQLFAQNVSFTKIIIKNGAVLQLKSFTKYRDAHTFTMINIAIDKVFFFITNLPKFLISSEGSKVFIFSSRYETSGHGTNAFLSKFNFSNIYVNEPYDNMYFFFLACGKLVIRDSSFYNISNSVIIYYLATIIDGTVLLDTLYCNFKALPINKFFMSSTEFFQNASILNVHINASIVFDSNLVQINNVLNFKINDCILEGASREGAILLIGVRELENFLCSNVMFIGDSQLMRKTSGLSFKAQLERTPFLNLSEMTQAGIVNCTFRFLLNTAIKIDQNSNVIIKNVTIYSIISEKTGGIILLTFSKALIINLFCFNISSFLSGGLLLADSSYVIMKNCNITSVKSFNFGGALMLFDSKIILLNVYFNDTSAKSGGSLSTENSEILIDSCDFTLGFGEKSGGFFNIITGLLIVINTDFLRGTSLAKAACIYTEGTNSRFLNISFQSSNSSKIGTVILVGSDDIAAFFSDCKFINNFATNCPTLVLQNLHVYFLRVIFLNNESLENLIEIYESYATSLVIFKEVLFQINKAEKALIYSLSQFLLIYQTAFLENSAFNHLKSSKCNTILFYKVITIPMPETETFDDIKHVQVHILDVKAKQLILESVIFEGNGCHGGLFVDSSSLVFLKKASIKNTKAVSGSAIYLLKSQLILDDCFILFCLGLENAVVAALNSNNMFIMKSMFISNHVHETLKAESSSDISFKSYDSRQFSKKKMWICDSTFMNVSHTSVFLSNSNFVMVKTNMFGNFFEEASQAVFIKEAFSIYLSDLLIFNFFEMGAIFVDNSKLKAENTSLFIEKSIFSNCSNNFSGGAMSVYGAFSIFCRSSIFLNMTSKEDGGAFYYGCFANLACKAVLVGENIFVFNKAWKKGGAIFIANNRAEISYEKIVFEKNEAAIGKNIASSPSKIKLINGLNKERVQEFKSFFETNNDFTAGIKTLNESANHFYFTDNVEMIIGKSVDLAFFLVDNYNNLMKDVSLIGFQINIVIQSQEIQALDPKIINNVAALKMGIGLFESLTVSVNNKTDQIVGIIKTLETRKNELQLQREIIFKLKPCEIGDTFVEDICFRCRPGFFSFEADPIQADSNCQPCPMNAVCSGGSSVQPLRGYWRAGNTSSIIVSCPNEEACPVKNETQKEKREECGEGYEGAFCGYCKLGYAMISGQCEKCTELRYFFGQFIPYILFFAFIFLAQKDIHSSNSTTEVRILTNTLSNHFSNLMLLSIFNLDWHIDVRNILSIFKYYVSPSSENIFSLGCLIPVGGDTLQRITLIVTIVSPLCLVLMFLLIRESAIVMSKSISRLVHKRIISRNNISTFKSLKFFKQHLRLAFLLVFFNIYPTLILSFIKAIDCVEIDTYFGVMKISPDIDCSSITYLLYEIVSGTSLLIWGLGIPLNLFLISRNFVKKVELASKVKQNFKHRKSNAAADVLTDSSVLNIRIHSKPRQKTWRNISFSSELGRYLTRGYKEKYYYWESILYLRKLFIIMLSLLANYLDTKVITEIVVCFFFCFFYINMRAEIYVSPRLQEIETFSLLTAIFTLSFGVLASKENGYYKRAIMYLVFAVLINIGFIIAWVRLYISIQFTQIKDLLSPKKKDSKTEK